MAPGTVHSPGLQDRSTVCGTRTGPRIQDQAQSLAPGRGTGHGWPDLRDNRSNYASSKRIRHSSSKHRAETGLGADVKNSGCDSCNVEDIRRMDSGFKGGRLGRPEQWAGTRAGCDITDIKGDDFDIRDARQGGPYFKSIRRSSSGCRDVRSGWASCRGGRISSPRDQAGTGLGTDSRNSGCDSFVTKDIRLGSDVKEIGGDCFGIGDTRRDGPDCEDIRSSDSGFKGIRRGRVEHQDWPCSRTRPQPLTPGPHNGSRNRPCHPGPSQLPASRSQAGRGHHSSTVVPGTDEVRQETRAEHRLQPPAPGRGHGCRRQTSDTGPGLSARTRSSGYGGGWHSGPKHQDGTWIGSDVENSRFDDCPGKESGPARAATRSVYQDGPATGISRDGGGTGFGLSPNRTSSFNSHQSGPG